MIELIILGMLSKGFPMTSYDLKKAMEKSTEFFHSSSLGSIQPALKKLELSGYLRSVEKIENNRLKKYYSVTETGKTYFAEGLRSDLGPDKIKCAQLLRVFFFENYDLDEQIQSIDQYLDYVKKIIASLNIIKTSGLEKMTEMGFALDDFPAAQYQMDTLRFGLDYYHFVSEWFIKYKEEIVNRQ